MQNTGGIVALLLNHRLIAAIPLGWAGARFPRIQVVKSMAVAQRAGNLDPGIQRPELGAIALCKSAGAASDLRRFRSVKRS